MPISNWQTTLIGDNGVDETIANHEDVFRSFKIGFEFPKLWEVIVEFLLVLNDQIDHPNCVHYETFNLSTLI